MPRIDGYGGREIGALSQDEESALIRAWRTARCHRSIARLLRARAGMALAAARRWTSNEDSLADLAQDGMIGILEAAESFEPALGVPFSVHCWGRVRRRVAEAAPSVLSVVDVPLKAWTPAGRSGFEGRGLAPAEAARSVLSFDEPDGVGAQLARTARDERADPEAEVERIALERRLESSLRTVLAEIPPMEAEVFRRRRLQDEPDSIEAICSDLVLSRDRAKSLEMKALRRVRDALGREGFRREVAA